MSADYLNVTSQVHLWKEKFESPAILKRGRNYFMFSSHLTGWRSNDNIYSSATSLSGPWSPWKTFAPPKSNTFNSQTTFILPISSNSAIYMGDRWVEQAPVDIYLCMAAAANIGHTGQPAELRGVGFSGSADRCCWAGTRYYVFCKARLFERKCQGPQQQRSWIPWWSWWWSCEIQEDSMQFRAAEDVEDRIC